MYIEEIVIDGFKSYATRTVLSGFDPHFNAITGLNGSGKSNILDSICFVLGISNLSQVRAGNLQELVYKQGQAGVTRAEVTLVFNNEDKRSSPIGKEHLNKFSVSRTVVAGGKNKYAIDGRTAQQSQVQNLFHSVQLNVNNPHFLIMQGRITKVLNMKPPEILGMIEEAAGTRMFENKRQSSLRTIEKKQAKVHEINSFLEGEINPRLEKLREEKRKHDAWESTGEELKRRERRLVAFEFSEVDRLVHESKDEALRFDERQAALAAKAAQLKAALKAKDAEMAALEGKRDGAAGKALKMAVATAEGLSKELVQANTQCQNKKTALKQDIAAIAALREDESTAGSVLAEKRREEETAAASAAQADKRREEAETAYASLHAEYQNMCAGITSSKEETQTLSEQLTAAAEATSAAEAAVAQAEMRAMHLSKEAKDLGKQARAAKKEDASLWREHEAAEAAAAKLEAQVAALGHDPAAAAALAVEVEAAETAAEALHETIERMQAQLAGRLRFDYSDPERGFDRTRVKGLVAQLVRVKEAAAATALEVAAGGKLYQVVVDTEQTGKLLLQNGRLRRRVTIIPLNKISRHDIDDWRLQRAADIARAGGGTAVCALELVGFDDEVSAAMEHTFGSSIVCDSLQTAKQVAFHKDVRARCVTLEGDSFEPAGTLTGGSRAQLGAVLAKLRELSEASEELGCRWEAAAATRKRLEAMATAAGSFAELSRAAELKRHEASVLAARRERSVHSQLEGKLEKTQAALDEAQEEARRAAAAGAEASTRRDRLQAEASSFKEKREGLLRAVEKRVAAAKTNAAKATEAARVQQQRLQVARREAKQLASEGSAAAQQAEAADAAAKAAAAEVEAMEAAVAAKRAAYATAEEAATARRVEVAELAAVQQALAKERRELADGLEAAGEEQKEHARQAKESGRKSANAAHQRKVLLHNHKWIQQDQRFFGSAGTDFDFSGYEYEKETQEVDDLRQSQKDKERTINKKVVGLIEKLEKEYEELVRKRGIIVNDKAKIEKVIDNLNDKKKEALQTTWVKVNRDFGSIFSTLLPGTSAKLQPPEGATALDGLEVKVAFGYVWKESLSELSGGQRSLLALSLILALLLFKPAPMYILDEVDAALDLSHTQNIGAMLRTHFSASQFLVVSLKEGMFNNANVIYRTKFIDGVSAVSRTVNLAAAAASGGARAPGRGGGGAASDAGGGRRKEDAADKARTKRGRLASGMENDSVAVA